MTTIKELSSWIAIIGFPSIFAMTAYCIKSIWSFFFQLKVLQEAQKAQMRAQLMDKYYEVKARGWIWADEVQEWSNQYEAYHVLKGKNEVLDTRKDEILAMKSQVR